MKKIVNLLLFASCLMLMNNIKIQNNVDFYESTNDILDKDIEVSYKPLLSVNYVENINKGRRNNKLILFGLHLIHYLIHLLNLL